MNEPFFAAVPGRVPHAGENADSPLAFRAYNPELIVLGKRMEDWLRISVAGWHSFAWNGSDMFGLGTLDRPWQDPTLEPMQAARLKMAAAFEFTPNAESRGACNLSRVRPAPRRNPGIAGFEESG